MSELGHWYGGFWRAQIILQQQQHQIAGLQHSVENAPQVVVSHLSSFPSPGGTLLLIQFHKLVNENQYGVDLKR
jgi:hypothetical protein